MGFFGSLIKGVGGAITGFATGGPAGAAIGAASAIGLTGTKTAKAQARARGAAGPTGVRSGAGSTAIPQLPVLRTAGIQAGPTRTGGRPARIEINPPFTGPPGIGVSIQQATRGNGARARAGARASLPMMGDIGTQPRVETRTIRLCPRGMRLAVDGLCYPKALLGKRSPFRAWPADPAPPVTAADAKALRKIDSVRNKVRSLGEKADLKVTSKTARRRSK